MRHGAPCVQVDEYGFFLDGRERHFASGSNHAGEIRACALSGRNAGVCVTRLNEEALAEAVYWLEAGVLHLFVDSGAFGEVAFTPRGLQVRREIGPADWARILRTYTRLVAAGGRRVRCVAPDRVGNQQVTVERLEMWRPELLRLRELGGLLIVPIQRGALSMERFWLRACEVLGFEDFVVGIPSRKEATPLEELRDFLLALPPLNPPELHFLGLGPDSPRWEATLAVVADACPRALVWCDSARIPALVGRGTARKDGTRGPVRPFTAARDAVLAEGLNPARVAEVKAAALARVFLGEHHALLSQARARGWQPESATFAATSA